MSVPTGYFDQSYPPNLYRAAPTGATAGSPGTFTPAGSYTPQTGAAIQSLTATPATAWTSGQYVQATNGEQRYWNGTAWVVGIKP